MNKPLGSWLDAREEPLSIEAECDLILNRSMINGKHKNFKVETSEVEVEFELCRYFDEQGNCLIVNAQTRQILYISASELEHRDDTPNA